MIQWFLAKLRVVDIMTRDGAALYLRRRWLLGHKTSYWALMLHEMFRPDDDGCHHDHPWAFITLVLHGGYWEEVTIQGHPADGGPRGEHFVRFGVTPGTYVIRRFNRPGMLLYRPPQHTHRITELPHGKCWTLVLRFKRTKSWGFLTRNGMVWYQDFLNMFSEFGAMWCDPDYDPEDLR